MIMNEYIWISEWIAYPTQTGKCGFDLILPLLKKPAHFLWLWSATFILNCPASSQQLPEAHFLLFEHLISLSIPQLSLSVNMHASPPPVPLLHTFGMGWGWLTSWAKYFPNLSLQGCRAFLGQVSLSWGWRVGTSCWWTLGQEGNRYWWKNLAYV